MALGSSAPEICLSLIEVLLVKHFQIGDLGPSTIVGSAAFNLLVITAVCISIVDDSRKINNKRVFLTTTFWSIFAYIWLYIILEVSSKGEIELWEAIVTFLFFPIVVLTSYLVEVFPKWYKKKYGHGLCVKCIPGDKEADEDEDKVEFVADLSKLIEKKTFFFILN
jgi:solute carrier family 8 (sodium/calcium exchanger)